MPCIFTHLLALTHLMTLMASALPLVTWPSHPPSLQPTWWPALAASSAATRPLLSACCRSVDASLSPTLVSSACTAAALPLAAARCKGVKPSLVRACDSAGFFWV